MKEKKGKMLGERDRQRVKANGCYSGRDWRQRGVGRMQERGADQRRGEGPVCSGQEGL